MHTYTLKVNKLFSWFGIMVDCFFYKYVVVGLNSVTVTLNEFSLSSPMNNEHSFADPGQRKKIT